MVTVIDNYMMNGFVRSYTILLDAVERFRQYVRKLDEEGATAMETLIIIGAVAAAGVATAAIVLTLTNQAGERVDAIGGATVAITTLG